MKHVEDMILAYLAGELDPERATVVEKHLAACPECRLEANRARTLWETLGSARAELPETGSIWPMVRARTLGRPAGRREWFYGGRPWMQTGLAAAAVAAGLVLGVLMPAAPVESDPSEGAALESSWLTESSWLSGTSWLADGQAVGLDDILLGADLISEEEGS